MAIQFTGKKSLTDEENSTLYRVYQKSLPKIERDLDKSKITLNIKKYNAHGKRARFYLHANINHPSVKFTAKAESWVFATALHKIFNKLETEIEKTQVRSKQKTVNF